MMLNISVCKTELKISLETYRRGFEIDGAEKGFV